MILVTGGLESYKATKILIPASGRGVLLCARRFCTMSKESVATLYDLDDTWVERAI